MADKVALITGAGSGVGRAAALGLAGAGYSRGPRRPAREPLEAVAAEAEALGAKALAVSTDVGDPESVAALFAAVKATFGRLDLLFNNAGIGAPAYPARGHHLRAVAGGGRRQPDRRLPLHPAGLPAVQGAEPARRPHHQQRLDLGARRRARTPRPTPPPSTPSPASPSRPRSTAGPSTSPAARSTSATPRPPMTAAMAEGVPQADGTHGGRAAHGPRLMSPTPSSTWRACRSTRTCCS